MENSFNLNNEYLLNLFSSSRTEIARTFLVSKLSFDLEKSTFENIRNHSISELDLDKELVPTDEKEFYEFICSEVLNLTKEPQEELLNQLKEAIDDLNFIHKIRERHQKSFDEINKDSNIEGKQYKLNLHKHYLNKIKNDEDQLIKFLREDLFTSAFSNSMQLKFPLFFSYPFRTAKIFYLHDNISEITHKIGFVPISEIAYYCELYKNNRRKFFRIVRQKYPPESLILKMKDIIKTNHILSKRKLILFKFLRFYLKNEWEIFANICPSQIEGMLYKLALEVGVRPDSLKTSSVTDKASLIYEKSKLFNGPDYEYFAFVFPIIRNRISHGQDIGENLSDFAYSLLFDLYTVCNYFKSFELKYNEAIFKQHKIEEDESDIYHLLGYINLIGTKIDSFYKPKYTDTDIKSLLVKEFIFDKIKEKVVPGTVFGVTIGSSARKLKKLNINIQECDKVIDYYKNDFN